jgi:hypothetical protein
MGCFWLYSDLTFGTGMEAVMITCTWYFCLESMLAINNLEKNLSFKLF